MRKVINAVTSYYTSSIAIAHTRTICNLAMLKNILALMGFITAHRILWVVVDL
jgi:hypothetical protein